MEQLAFNGPEYQHDRDFKRLKTQHERIKAAMSDGKWRTLDQISELTGDPVASVSAQLRHLRKPRFGGHNVERDHLGNGLFQYRLVA